jgi:uncharacterized glyoxalase superfamily protein PhnB
VLHVLDVEATAKYYRDALGFIWDFGDKDYAVVWRDNSAIHFVKDERNPAGVHIFQWIRDVDAYYKEVLERGADITAAPSDRPYGIREFTVRDPNGIAIIFGQDIDAEQAAQTDRA